jgi:mycothiol synthase
VNVRPITENDLERVAAFLAEAEARQFGRPSRVGIDDVRGWLGSSDLERDTWLFDEDGLQIALGWVEKHEEVGIAVGVVDADRQRRGLGSELIDRMEERLASLVVDRIHNIALAPDAAAAALLAARGYREVRRFWEMTIELGDEPPPEPRLPDGLRVEPFSGGAARAFHAALEEAFADHWEHRPETFEKWWERQQRKHDHDPSLWVLVRDGDEVVGVARNDPKRSGGGWVGALGVRPAWRGRGVARALLLHSFRIFHTRGERRVGLGVDAENATGATRLYESVGMTVDLETVVWEKVLA